MRRLSPFDAVAGLLGFAVAAGVTELLAASFGVVSPRVAAGNVIIRYAPEFAVRFAIATFGRNDKAALLTTLAVLTLAFGAAIGVLTRRRPSIGTGGFALWCVITALLMTVEKTQFTAAAAVTGFGAIAGWATLRLLLRRAPADVPLPSENRDEGRLDVPTPDRRAFLGLAITAAGVAVASFIAGRKVAGRDVDVEAQRQTIALPRAQTPLPPVPSTAALDVRGISPLVTPNSDFYRIDTTLSTPRIDIDRWRLRITGMVDQPQEFSFTDLLAMPVQEADVTLACVSNEVGDDLVGNARWLGIPLPDLLKRAGVQRGATQIAGHSVDGFTVGFPTDVALDGRPSLVVIGMNGEPLPAEHGFPARLLVPGLYGYVSATKWLSELRLTTAEAFDAYWIRRGWSKLGPIKTQSRIDVPTGRQPLAAGQTSVAGVAWAGIRSISAVEVRILPTGVSDGPWQRAQLGEALSPSTWRQWVIAWDATPGDYQITVRATDGRGDTQTANDQPPAPDGATGHHKVRVRVT